MAGLGTEETDELVLLGDVVPVLVTDTDGPEAGGRAQKQGDFELLRSIMEARMAALNQSIAQQEHMIKGLNEAEAKARQQNSCCMERIADLEIDLAAKDQDILDLRAALSAVEAQSLPASSPVLHIPCTSKSQELLHAQDQVCQLKQALQEAHSVQLQEAVGNHKTVSGLEAQVKALRVEQEGLRRKLSDCNTQQERDQRQHALELASLRKAANTAQQRLAALQEEHRASRSQVKAKEEEANNASKRVRQLQQELERARSPAPQRACTPPPSKRATTPPPAKRFSTPPPAKRAVTPPPCSARGPGLSTPTGVQQSRGVQQGTGAQQVTSPGARQAAASSTARARTPPSASTVQSTEAVGAQHVAVGQEEVVSTPKSHPIVKSPAASASLSPATRHGSPPWRFPKPDATSLTPCPNSTVTDDTPVSTTAVHANGGRYVTAGAQDASKRVASCRNVSPLSVPRSASPGQQRATCRSPTVWRGAASGAADSLFKDLPHSGHTCSTITGTQKSESDQAVQPHQHGPLPGMQQQRAMASSPAADINSPTTCNVRTNAAKRAQRQMPDPPASDNKFGSPACRTSVYPSSTAVNTAIPAAGYSAVQLWEMFASMHSNRQAMGESSRQATGDCKRSSTATAPFSSAERLPVEVSQLVQHYLRAINAHNVASSRLEVLMQQKQHNAMQDKSPVSPADNTTQCQDVRYSAAKMAASPVALQHSIAALQRAVQRADSVLVELQRRLAAVPVADLQAAIQVALHALVAATTAAAADSAAFAGQQFGAASSNDLQANSDAPSQPKLTQQQAPQSTSGPAGGRPRDSSAANTGMPADFNSLKGSSVSPLDGVCIGGNSSRHGANPAAYGGGMGAIHSSHDSSVDEDGNGSANNTLGTWGSSNLTVTAACLQDTGCMGDRDTLPSSQQMHPSRDADQDEQQGHSKEGITDAGQGGQQGGSKVGSRDVTQDGRVSGVSRVVATASCTVTCGEQQVKELSLSGAVEAGVVDGTAVVSAVDPATMLLQPVKAVADQLTVVREDLQPPQAAAAAAGGEAAAFSGRSGAGQVDGQDYSNSTETALCGDGIPVQGRHASPSRVFMQLPQVLRLDDDSSGGSSGADCQLALDQGTHNHRTADCQAALNEGLKAADTGLSTTPTGARNSQHRYSQCVTGTAGGKRHLWLTVPDDDLSDDSPRAQPVRPHTARPKLKSMTSPGDAQPRPRSAVPKRVTESAALPATAGVLPRRRSKSLVLSPRGVPLAAAARHNRAQSLSQAAFTFGGGSTSRSSCTRLLTPARPAPSVRSPSVAAHAGMCLSGLSNTAQE